MVPLSRGFDYRPGLSLGGLTARQALQPQGACPLVWALPRSLAATSGITDLFSFPAGTEMVHFPALPSAPYVFRDGYSGITQSGFPHSEIPGSKPACGSPRLIAACHVLHRLLAPRHSPYALSSLITETFPQHCVCVVKKLPIAEYSVVKEFERSAASRPWQIVVENTGIEPVTSWLQTRRSPS
jgi:hypothetical protein